MHPNPSKAWAPFSLKARVKETNLFFFMCYVRVTVARKSLFFRRAGPRCLISFSSAVFVFFWLGRITILQQTFHVRKSHEAALERLFWGCCFSPAGVFEALNVFNTTTLEKNKHKFTICTRAGLLSASADSKDPRRKIHPLLVQDIFVFMSVKVLKVNRKYSHASAAVYSAVIYQLSFTREQVKLSDLWCCAKLSKCPWLEVKPKVLYKDLLYFQTWIMCRL